MSKVDLLSVGWIRSLLKSWWFPLAFQLTMLVAFGLLIAGGLWVGSSDPELAKELRNTNLANLVVWSYWFPLLIVSVVLLGRVWCMVCPMELITALTVRVGLQLKVPGFFRSGWLITVFYALILIVGIHGLSVHRAPHRMALYLLMLLGIAVVVSLIYRKRAFCSYVCPVGHLLGLYALIAPLQWRADNLSVCRSCKTKDCIAKRNHYRIVGRSCTSNLYPATIRNNADCLLCTQCLKVCPYDNIQFSLRKPYADFFGTIELRTAQIAFILLVSGFVVYEVLSEWPVSEAILTWVPNHFVSALSIKGPIAKLFSAVIMFIIFPCVLLLIIVALARIRSSAAAGAIANAFCLLLLPTMASAHITKAVLKTTSRIPYWRHAFLDPCGILTAQKMLDGKVVLNTSVVNVLYPAVTVTVVVLFVFALSATLWIFCKLSTTKNLNSGARVAIFLGVCAYWAVFAITILKWRLWA